MRPANPRGLGHHIACAMYSLRVRISAVASRNHIGSALGNASTSTLREGWALLCMGSVVLHRKSIRPLWLRISKLKCMVQWMLCTLYIVVIFGLAAQDSTFKGMMAFPTMTTSTNVKFLIPVGYVILGIDICTWVLDFLVMLTNRRRLSRYVSQEFADTVC